MKRSEITLGSGARSGFGSHFVRDGIENGERFGYLQDFMEFSVQVTDADGCTLSLGGDIRSDQSVYPGARDTPNVRHVEDDLLFFLPQSGSSISHEENCCPRRARFARAAPPRSRVHQFRRSVAPDPPRAARINR